MNINLNEIPCWYMVISMILSFYYSIRGGRANYLFNLNRIKEDDAKIKNDSASKREWPLNKWQSFWIYSLHDFIFHLICSLSGFFALYLLGTNYQVMSSNAATTGDSILIVFLSLYSIIGITGMLPQLIQQGKLPGMK